MESHQATVNYARALFDARGSQQETKQRLTQLELIADVLQENPALLHLLGYPEYTVNQKLGELENVLQIRFDEAVKSLLGLLIKRQKASQIRKVAAEYHKLVVTGLDEIDVEITSAEPLSEQTKKELQNTLEKKFNKKLYLIEKVDPTLLGGFSILVHNKLLDLSIKESASKLKKQLMKVEI